jgi:hypothetical protein
VSAIVPDRDSPPVYYAEDRSAVNGRLIFHTLFWPAVVVVCVVSSSVLTELVTFLPAVLALYGWSRSSIGPFGLYMCWPIGIRVDAAGIRIGGIRRAARIADETKKPWTSAPVQHRREVFFCPWGAVQRVTVVTDKDELKKLRRASQDFGFGKINPVVSVGRLWSPLMRAALVINLDTDRVVFPLFLERGEQLHKKLGTYTNKRGYYRSPVWITPTRHPDRLRAALERCGAPVS